MADREIGKFGEIESKTNTVTRVLLVYMIGDNMAQKTGVVESEVAALAAQYDADSRAYGYIMARGSNIAATVEADIRDLAGKDISQTQFSDIQDSVGVLEQVKAHFEGEVRWLIQQVEEFVQAQLQSGLDAETFFGEEGEDSFVPVPGIIGLLAAKYWGRFQNDTAIGFLIENPTTGLSSVLRIPVWVADSIIRPVFNSSFMNPLRRIVSSQRPTTWTEFEQEIETNFQVALITAGMKWQAVNAGITTNPELSTSFFYGMQRQIAMDIKSQYGRGLDPFLKTLQGQNVDNDEEEENAFDTAIKARAAAVVDPYLRGDALYLVDLNMTCEDITVALEKMDVINGQIPIPGFSGSGIGQQRVDENLKLRQDFENTYRILYNYKNTFCTSLQHTEDLLMSCVTSSMGLARVDETTVSAAPVFQLGEQLEIAGHSDLALRVITWLKVYLDDSISLHDRIYGSQSQWTSAEQALIREAAVAAGFNTAPAATTSLVFVNKTNMRDATSLPEAPLMKPEIHQAFEDIFGQAEDGLFLPNGMIGGRKLLELANDDGRRLAGEIEKAKTAYKELMHLNLDSWVQKPWEGPLVQNYQGIYVPYSAMEEGMELFKLYLARDVRSFFIKINKMATEGEEGESNYYPTADTLLSIIRTVRESYYDEELSPWATELWGSIIESSWKQCAERILYCEGNEYDTFDNFWWTEVKPALDAAVSYAKGEIIRLTDIQKKPEDTLSMLVTESPVVPEVGDSVEGRESGATGTIVATRITSGSAFFGNWNGWVFIDVDRPKIAIDRKEFTSEQLKFNGIESGAGAVGMPRGVQDYGAIVDAGTVRFLPASKLQSIVADLTAYQGLIPHELRADFEDIFQAFQQQLSVVVPSTYMMYTPEEARIWTSDQQGIIADKFSQSIELSRVLLRSAGGALASLYEQGVRYLGTAQSMISEGAGAPTKMLYSALLAKRKETLLSADMLMQTWQTSSDSAILMKLSSLIEGVQTALEQPEYEGGYAPSVGMSEDEVVEVRQIVAAAKNPRSIINADIATSLSQLLDLNHAAYTRFGAMWGAPSHQIELSDSLHFPSSEAGELDTESDEDQSRIGGGVFQPFVAFDGQRPAYAYHVEAFTNDDLEPCMKEFVRPRVKDGLSIEPKYHGFRAVLQCRNSIPRIFLEGIRRDMSDVYPEIARALVKGPDVLLEGEIMESIDGNLETRPISFTEKQVRQSKAVAVCFNCLYLDEQELEDSTYLVRRQAMTRYFSSVSSDHLTEMPNTWGNTEVDVLTAIQKYERYAGSEGAVLKTRDHVHSLKSPTEEWAKIKARLSLFVTVLNSNKTAGGLTVFTCGVVYDNEPSVNRNEIVKVKGIDYVKVGKTFGTKKKAAIGDELEVAVTELLEFQTNGELRYEWQDPKVVGVVTREPDTLGRAIQVGYILQASISQPYRVLNDLWRDARNASTMETLSELYKDAMDYLSSFNYARLQRLALAVSDYIEIRMDEVPDTQLGEIGYVMDVGYTTQSEVEEYKNIFNNLSVSVNTEPGRVIGQLNTLRMEINSAFHNSDEPMIKEQLASLHSFIEQEIEDRSMIDGFEMTFDSMTQLWGQNAYMAQQLYYSWEADPDDPTLLNKATTIYESVIGLMSAAGQYNNAFSGSYISQIFPYLETVLAEADAELKWAQIMVIIIEAQEMLQASMDEQEQFMSAFFVLAGKERAGEAEKRFYWESPLMDMQYVDQALDTPPIPAISFTTPDFGNTETAPDLNIGQTFGSTDEVSDADRFAQIQDMQALQAAISASYKKDYPRLIRQSVSAMAEKFTERQETAFSGWLTSMLQDSLLIENEWQILWDYVVGVRVATSLRMERVVRRLTASNDPVDEMAFGALRALSGNGGKDLLPVLDVEQGTMRLLYANEILPGEIRPWRDLRWEEVVGAAAEIVHTLKQAAREFIATGGLSVEGFVNSTIFSNILAAITSPIDITIENRLKTIQLDGDEVWMDDTNPYPVGNENTPEKHAEPFWIDASDTWFTEEEESSPGADHIRERIFGQQGSGRALVQKQKDGWILLAHVESNGDVEGNPNAMIDLVWDRIRTTLRAEPTVERSLAGNGVMSAEDYEQHEEQVKQSLAGLVGVGVTSDVETSFGNVQVSGDCGGFYVGSSKDGFPMFVSAAHCFPNAKAGDIAELRPLTGEIIRGRVQWIGKHTVTEGSNEVVEDVAIIVVEEGLEIAKTSGMMGVKLANDRSDVAIVVNPADGIADVLFYEGPDAGSSFDLYRGYEAAGPGTSGWFLINPDGSVAAIWNGRSTSAEGGIKPNRFGVTTTAETLMRIFEKAGVAWPTMSVLPLEEWMRMDASAPDMKPGVGQGSIILPSSGDLAKLSIPSLNVEIGIRVGDKGKFFIGYRENARLGIVTEAPDADGESIAFAVLPSRMRPADGLDAYYEFYIKSEEYPGLNGMWGISQSAAEEYDDEAFLFKMKDETPFWRKTDKRNAGERSKLPAEQKPGLEQIKAFLGRELILGRDE